MLNDCLNESFNECLNAWMNAWNYAESKAWINAWKYVGMKAWMNAWILGWSFECLNECLNGLMNAWMNAWMFEWLVVGIISPLNSLAAGLTREPPDINSCSTQNLRYYRIRCLGSGSVGSATFSLPPRDKNCKQNWWEKRDYQK